MFSAIPAATRVPIIFEGDLAHTAAMHLKQMDTVHIAGQLSPDPLPINLTNDRVDVQVWFYFIIEIGQALCLSVFKV